MTSYKKPLHTLPSRSKQPHNPNLSKSVAITTKEKEKRGTTKAHSACQECFQNNV